VSVLGDAVGRNVAALRQRQGLSLSELARQAGLSKNTLLSIERGVANPTVETLHVLTRALNASIVELISEGSSDGSDVVRAGEGPELDGLQMHVRILYRVSAGPISVETYEVSLDAGAEQDSPAHNPGVVEQVYVIEGRMRVGPLDRMMFLEAGDMACFASDVPHRYEAAGEPARALMLMMMPVVSPIVRRQP
jgi:transcriptional regulator with XRE-family HTH domain